MRPSARSPRLRALGHEIENPWPDDRDVGATIPKLKPWFDITVTFADSAASLPQNDIRTAIERELERRPLSESLAGELNIALEGPKIVVRFHSAAHHAERALPLPDDRSQIPLMLSLIAGNLARDQRPGVRTEPDLDTVLAPVPPPAGAYRHNYVGVRVAQDFLAIGALELATTRVLLGYDIAPSSDVTFGARAGMSFGGGPGSGGDTYTSFPIHLEFRGSYWFAPLTNQLWRGFIGFSVGVAQVHATVEHDGDIQSWKSAGSAFYALNTGGSVTLTGDLALAFDVNAMLLFPDTGFALEPAAGFVLGF